MSSKPHLPCQLKHFIKASKPDEVVSWVLDLELFRVALASGAPIPSFNRVKKDGTMGRDGRRDLKAGKVTHILNSGLTPEFYKQVHGVSALIVRHVRGVHDQGRLAGRNDALRVERWRGEVRVVRLARS